MCARACECEHVFHEYVFVVYVGPLSAADPHLPSFPWLLAGLETFWLYKGLSCCAWRGLCVPLGLAGSQGQFQHFLALVSSHRDQPLLGALTLRGVLGSFHRPTSTAQLPGPCRTQQVLQNLFSEWAVDGRWNKYLHK